MGLWQQRDGLEVYIPEAAPVRIWPGTRRLPPPPEDPPEIPDLPGFPPTPERSPWWTYAPWFLMSAVYGLMGPLAFGGRGWMYLLFIPLAAGSSLLAGEIQYRWALRRHRAQAAEAIQRAERRLRRFLAELEAWRSAEEILERALFPSWEELAQRLQAGTDLWFRHRGDPDFLMVRAGVRRVPLLIRPNRRPPDPEDLPLSLQSTARALAAAMSAQVERPLPLSFRASTALVVFPGLEGALARVLLELALTHSPAELEIRVGLRDPYWAFLRWLPHVGELREGYAGGPVRIREELFAYFFRRRSGGGLEGPAVLALGDAEWLTDARLGVLLREGPAAGIHPILILPPGAPVPAGIRTLGIWMPDGNVRVLDLTSGQSLEGEDPAPRLSLAQAEAIARGLARLRPMGRGEGAAVRPAPALWGLADPQTIAEAIRAARFAREGLGVPVGYTDEGTPFVLDLHDRAYGPHAMVIGTTGSGKSEAMRTLALALALHFPPERIQLLFIDFKGGGAFAPLEGLPHSVGLLSNLDAREAARALETLEGELDRRQRILAERGADHADAAGLPHLVVMVDEFAEMLDQIPDGMGRMIRLARLGRSLGMHLVLATQRLGAAVPGELRANLRVRIALRCETPEESTAVLGRPDAAYLPGSGWAFIQVGQNEVFQRIRFGYVSGFSIGVREEIGMDPADPGRELRRQRVGGDGIRDLDRLVAALRSLDPPVPRLAPPPLPEDPGAPREESCHRIGIGVADFPERGEIRWVFCDDRTPDLHLIGQSGTGKTRVLRAMTAAAACAGRRVFLVDDRGDWQDAAWTVRVDPSDREGMGRLFRALQGEEGPSLLVLDGVDGMAEEAQAMIEAGLEATRDRAELWVWTAARREVMWRPLRGRPAHRVVLAMEARDWEAVVGRLPAPEAPFQGRWWGEGRWREIRLRRREAAAPPAPPLPRAPQGSGSDLPPAVRAEEGVMLPLGWWDEDLQPAVLLLDRRRPALGIAPEIAWGRGAMEGLVRRLRGMGEEILVWDPEGLLERVAEGFEDPQAFLKRAMAGEAEGTGGVLVVTDTDVFRTRLGYGEEIPLMLRRSGRWIWLWAGRDGLGLRGWRLLPEPEDRRAPPIAKDHPGLAWLAEPSRGRWIILPVVP
ncbi:FtsK/SpoIIIE domain-containing protein [Thermoflexus sp.]|uniref:FtsK/SpoIIIE domain-containing protein n=1 Tax=Thermoflexus sp. TaxID=1969742 RepID=UPI0025EE16D3|nr:FtsK/SpoIIIE domain-containing protein [Thermoflexus sp.]MCS7351620.1 FtsK/SpoIIIE domain-containing protein [Thermoflexus sp.]MCX7690882.1 FtsK/SpoIIIE domain-containing protein [Thermoflexus sp.]MDW8181078.1 FtsK/SpoIIIE domain-containing protein [Anaerolineae bacterium]